MSCLRFIQVLERTNSLLINNLPDGYNQICIRFQLDRELENIKAFFFTLQTDGLCFSFASLTDTLTCPLPVRLRLWLIKPAARAARPDSVYVDLQFVLSCSRSYFLPGSTVPTEKQRAIPVNVSLPNTRRRVIYQGYTGTFCRRRSLQIDWLLPHLNRTLKLCEWNINVSLICFFYNYNSDLFFDPID